MYKKTTLFFVLIFLISTVTLWAQNQVSGIVLDDENIPLPSATILVKGTQNGVVSDFDGNFRIKAAIGDVLEISFIGMKTKELKVENYQPLTITLESESNLLNDVVIVGYGSQKRSDVTGSISSIKSEDLNKGVVTNPGQLLQGKMSGVNITSVSGEPGSGQNIIIRGMGSLRSGTSPLYVVDGFALDNSGVGVPTNPLNYLNPEDIETIDVLKDASAAAIYGARAANGVIVITTKKGKVGATQMNFSVTSSVSTIANKIDVFGTDEFKRQVVLAGGELSDGGANTDWQDELTRGAFSKRINASMSGGTENLNYFTSLGVDDIEGILEHSDLKRYSARVNLTQKALDKRLKVEYNLSGTRTENTRPRTLSIVTDMLELNPTVSPYTNGIPTDLGDRINPFITQTTYRDLTNNNRIFGNISPSLKIVKGLTYKLNLGLDYSTTTRDVQQSPYALVGINEGTLTTYSNTNRTSQIENTLTYNLANENHDVTILAGHSYLENYYTLKRWSYENFPDNGVEPRYQMSLGNLIEDGDDAVINELQSYFGRVSYSYDSRYLLTATMRADGSSKFGENNKYGYFPSVALGWNIHNEKFLENGSFDNLKLRLSWGQTGNQDIPSKITKASYGESQSDNDIYPLDDTTTSVEGYPLGLVYSRTANPDIQWEVTTQTNIGLDFGLLDSKLSGSIDVFNKVSENVLLEVVPADPIQPTATYWTNIPDMEIINNGIEFALDFQDYGNENFSYNIGGNFTYIENEVKNSPYQVLTTGTAQGSGQSGSTINGYINGSPIGAFYMREFTGIDGDGFSTYKDINQDGDIDDRDRIYAGSALPKYYYAFYLKCNYKDFDLGLNFNGVGGNKIYNHTRMTSFNIGNIRGSSNTTNQATEYLNEASENSNAVSTRYLEDGGFLRLNNATLGYSLKPKHVGLNNWVKDIRLSMTGENLFVITDYTGFDPEVNGGIEGGGVKTFGIDYYTYPRARTFLLGLNVSF